MNAKFSPVSPFVGSYPASDCQFLLQKIDMEYKTIADKEKLIQTGQMHYSETISKESPPSDAYLNLFYSMTEKYAERLAADSMRLAKIMMDENPNNGREGQKPLVIVSLARAGTPIGVMLVHALKRFNINAVHYSVSIIRDIGIDEMAIDYIVQNHGDEGICFVDGWTAKGVITKQLHKSIAEYNEAKGTKVSKALYVISDIGGTADFAATFADYTIPSSLLNSTVSGLISRSICNSKTEGGLHGCIYGELAEFDKSNWFIDQIKPHLSLDNVTEEMEIPASKMRAITVSYLGLVKEQYGVTDINRIKPGIAEATRVMLRRVPDVLILRDRSSTDTDHLVRLAEEKGIQIVIDALMPFGACALIKDVTE